MVGASAAVATYAFKEAFVQAATTLYATAHPELEIIRGLVGANHPDQYVQVLGTTTRHDPATLGTNRSREETVELETQWFVFRGGEVDADREAEQYLFDRIAELERHLRVDDITLGGTVRQVFLTEIATDSASIDQAGTGQGRLQAAIVLWEAKIRITNQP